MAIPPFDGPTLCVLVDEGDDGVECVRAFIEATRTYCTRLQVVGALARSFRPGDASVSRCFVPSAQPQDQVGSRGLRSPEPAPMRPTTAASESHGVPSYYVVLVGDDAVALSIADSIERQSQRSATASVLLNAPWSLTETGPDAEHGDSGAWLGHWRWLRRRWTPAVRQAAAACHVDLAATNAEENDSSECHRVRIDVMGGVVCGIQAVPGNASPLASGSAFPSAALEQHPARDHLSRGAWIRMMAGVAGVVRAFDWLPVVTVDAGLRWAPASQQWRLWLTGLDLRPAGLARSQSPWPVHNAHGSWDSPVQFPPSPRASPSFAALCALLAAADPAVDRHGLPLFSPRLWLSKLNRAMAVVTGSARGDTGAGRSSLGLALRARYRDDRLVRDRLAALDEVIRDALAHGFTLDDPVCVVASPGRHRVFMGHTDFAGLGGPTVNANTREELLVAAQWHWARTATAVDDTSNGGMDGDDGADEDEVDGDDDDLHACRVTTALSAANQALAPPSSLANGGSSMGDEASECSVGIGHDDEQEVVELPPIDGADCGTGCILLTNAEAELHPAKRFSFDSLVAVADDDAAWGQVNWPTDQWDSYVRGTLAYLASKRCPLAANQLRAAMRGGRSGHRRVLRVHAARPGVLRLPSSGGVSSSSSLTGAVALSVRRLLHLPGLPLHEIAEVDQGEWLLGKCIGSADKTAQLYARPGRVVVVGSHPVRFLGDVSFPRSLCVLMAECPVPRLTTADGLRYLRARQPDDGDAGVEAVRAWAQTTMQRNSSHAFVLAVSLLQAALASTSAVSAVGGLDAPADRALLRDALDSGLLREWCAGGRLDHALRAAGAGADHNVRRWRLIYRALGLLPEESRDPTTGRLYSVRKAALYGLAECERGAVFCDALAQACAAEARNDGRALLAAQGTILDLVARAHDGDRALSDYRPGLAAGGALRPTSWAHNPQSGASSSQLAQWLAEDTPLHWVPGGFERSLPDIDEAADELRRRFPGQAELRVSAAGLGGAVAVYTLRSAEPDVRRWLLSLGGWKLSNVDPGPPTAALSM